MKTFKRMILILLILFAAIGIAVYLFLPLDRIAKNRLEEVLGPDFSIEKVAISLAHLKINNLRYKDSEHRITGAIKIDEIKVYPSLLLLLTGRIVIKKIEVASPYILLQRFDDNKWTISKLLGGGGSMPIVLKGIKITNGNLDIRDDRAGKSPFKVKIDDLMIDIDNPVSIFQQGSAIDTSGRIAAKRQGNISIKGKWDALTGRFAGDVKIDEIDMTILNPYLAGTDGAIITSGILNLHSKVKLENGSVNAPVDAIVKDLAVKSEGGGYLFGISVPVIISLIEKEGTVNLRFNVYGPLKNIQTDLKDALKKKVDDSVQEKLESPIKRLGRDLKDIGKGILDVFR